MSEIEKNKEENEDAELPGNWGFVRLCYGVVGEYMDTSHMTTDEVIEEFLNRNGVSSPREYFEKKKNEKPETYEDVKKKTLEAPKDDSGTLPEKNATEEPAPAADAEPPQRRDTYYATINEDSARRAKEAISWDSYKSGSATASYRAQVDEARKIADEAIANRPEDQERIEALFRSYADKLADNINKDNANTASYPSVMIAGASNFNVARKEKQNARAEALYEDYKSIEAIKDKIRGIASNKAIYSDDDNAIAKLQSKLDRLKQSQELMKNANAYYRKNGNLDGFPDLSDKQKAEIVNVMKYNPWENKPFASYALTNNNSEIRRVEERIATLTKAKEAAAQPKTEAEKAQNSGDGWRYEEDGNAMRVQFYFDGKPDESTRTMLKSYGFRWAPSVGAWQRQLTSNGQYAAKTVMKKLKGEN